MVGIKHVNMEEKIYEVLRKHKLPLKKREELIVDLLDLFSVSQQSELLIKFLEFGRDRHYTPLTQCSIIDMVEDFELNQ